MIANPATERRTHVVHYRHSRAPAEATAVGSSITHLLEELQVIISSHEITGLIRHLITAERFLRSTEKAAVAKKGIGIVTLVLVLAVL